MTSVFNSNSPENPLVANYAVGAYGYTLLHKTETNYTFASSTLLACYLHWQGAKATLLKYIFVPSRLCGEKLFNRTAA
jgi:hypothetical protein